MLCLAIGVGLALLLLPLQSQADNSAKSVGNKPAVRPPGKIIPPQQATLYQGTYIGGHKVRLDGLFAHPLTNAGSIVKPGGPRFRAPIIRFSFAQAQFVVKDTNGDGALNLADVNKGDQVYVLAIGQTWGPIPAKAQSDRDVIRPAPLAAQWLIDRTQFPSPRISTVS